MKEDSHQEVALKQLGEFPTKHRLKDVNCERLIVRTYWGRVVDLCVCMVHVMFPFHQSTEMHGFIKSLISLFPECY